MQASKREPRFMGGVGPSRHHNNQNPINHLGDWLVSQRFNILA